MAQMEFEELRSKINTYLIKKTDFLKVKEGMNEDQLRVYVDTAISQLCDEEDVSMSMEMRIKLVRALVTATASLGPLRPLMEDPEVTEIMVNGPFIIYVQKHGRIELADVKFENDQHLSHTIQKILAASGSSRRVDESSPYVDFSTQDGSRYNVILPPCSIIGPVMTIRKFSKEISTLENLIELGTLDQRMADILVGAMKAKLNVVFSGATGSGKTTTLNVLSRHVPEDERIITIEDTPELRLHQDHVVPLQTKPANIEGRGMITIRDLFVNSLRMRPDRIIIGEVRSGEMLDMIEAITSGHTGSLAIVHADSSEDCFSRMVTLMIMSGISLTTDEIRKQVAKSIDLVVQLELFPDGIRRVTSITDVHYDKMRDQIILRDMFRFIEDKVDSDVVEGHWVMDKARPSFYNRFLKRHVTFPQGFFEDGA